MYLSSFLPSYQCIYLGFYLPTNVSIKVLPSYQCIYLGFYLPTNVSIKVSTFLPMYLSRFLPSYQCIYLGFYLPTNVSINLLTKFVPMIAVCQYLKVNLYILYSSSLSFKTIFNISLPLDSGYIYSSSIIHKFTFV